MITFEEKIISLTGISSNTQNKTYINGWIEMAAKDVLAMLPNAALMDCTLTKTLNRTDRYFENVDESMVMHVSRKYTNKGSNLNYVGAIEGRYRDCRQVSHTSISLAEEDSGYLESCSVEDPVYYIYKNNLHVLPQVDDDYDALVHYVVFPVAATNDNLYDKTSIPNFPNLLEQAVVYRAASNAARFLFQDEQDEEIYMPMIKDLTNQFANSIKLFLSQYKKSAPIEEEATGTSTNNVMKALQKAMGGEK